jgi:dTDP-4-amino-4,6-dideoxygalactose transaminase
MNVPFLKFEKMQIDLGTSMQNALQEVLDSQWYVMGKKLSLFEEAYANFNKTKYCVGVANGLDALILSLRVLNIKEGDEVIVPSNTYIASWLAVSGVGATPIPVEPNKFTYNIDCDFIENKITNKTKAIMPVHLYGQACNMTTITEIAKKYKLHIIEDNAQSQGAMCNGKLTGSFGSCNATSFYPGKNLGALGDAGGVTTDNEEFYTQLKILRNYGSEKKYFNVTKGINSRLDELQAAFLLCKLPLLNTWNQERNIISQKYNQRLRNVADLILPEIAKNCSSVFHLYVIRSKQRDKLQRHLSNKDIGTLIHYPVPPHLQEAYKELNYKKGDFPIAEHIAETALSLPIYPGISNNEIDWICESIKNFYLKSSYV